MQHQEPILQLSMVLVRTILLANSNTIGGCSTVASGLGILISIGLVHIGRVHCGVGSRLPRVGSDGARVVVPLLQLAACKQ